MRVLGWFFREPVNDSKTNRTNPKTNASNWREFVVGIDSGFRGAAVRQPHQISTGEFDPGSERTLAAGLTHASRTRKVFGLSRVAHG